MRLVSVARCEEGMKLAKPIFQENGTLLLGTGISLTDRLIRHLQGKNITFLYIQDKATEDLDIYDDIPPQVRQKALQTIESVFTDIQSGQHKRSKGVSQRNLVKDFKPIFESLMKEVRHSKQFMNLLTTIQAKDNDVFTHSLNVTLYSLAIASKMGFNDKQLAEIGLGALLHDIGKMLIPKEILDKPGKLTTEEFDMIKKHSEYGFELLRKERDVPLLSAHCAFQHHERVDGSGYPRGLKGEDIHIYSRIMAVADVFDALTTHRVYRRAMLPHEAMELIYSQTHTQFQADIVEAFRNSVAIYPLGITVTLNTGEIGVVVDYNRHSPGRPVVRVLKGPEGQECSPYYEIDLSKALTKMIAECDAIL